MNDDELIKMAIGAFIDDLPARLEELKQSAAEGDSAGLKTRGHRLKGAAASVGAEELSAIGKIIEQAGAEDDIERGRELVAELDAASGRLAAEAAALGLSAA